MNSKVRVIILSIVSSALVLIYQFFKWDIINAISPFSIFLWLILLAGFVFVSIYSILIIKRKEWIPLLIQFITILLLFFVPFTEIAIKSNFQKNKTERLKVVQIVENSNFKPDYHNNLPTFNLPNEYKSLSSGGFVILKHNNLGEYCILFLTYRGILDSFSGFVYSPDDTPPSQGDFNGEFRQIKKYDKNWYFVSTG
jgi:hypothetical protein